MKTAILVPNINQPILRVHVHLYLVYSPIFLNIYRTWTKKERWTLSVIEKVLKNAENKDYRRLGLSRREAEKKLEIFGHNTIMV